MASARFGQTYDASSFTIRIDGVPPNGARSLSVSGGGVPDRAAKSAYGVQRRRPFGRAELAVVQHKVRLVSARFRLSATQRDELLSSVLESITLALRDLEKLRSVEEIGLFAYDTAQHRAIDLLAEDRRTLSPYGDAVHPWLDAVRAHVRAQQPDDLGRVHLEASSVASAIGQPGGAQGVGRCLSMLGFQLRQARRDGTRVRRWVWSP